MYYSVLTVLSISVTLTHSIDLCDKQLETNLTVYSSAEIQNCGCKENCIRKCCKPGFHFGKKRSCYKLEGNQSQYIVPVYRGKTHFTKNISEVNNFVIGILECTKFFQLNDFNPSDSYFVQENGLLYMPNMSHGTFYENTHYCVDERNGLSVFLCFPGYYPSKVHSVQVNTIGMIISMPFLLATFLVYAILPDRNLHQRALMLYVLTLCISYVLLVTVNLAVFDEPLCPIVGYLTMFFFMVSFFWINVICFDIWYTFSGGRGFVGSKRSSETRRFLLYNIYAWGVPLLHIGVVLLMQHIILPADSKHNPNVGTGKCFLNDGYPNLWYFYGEAGILIIINVILFLRTAFKIRQVKKETSMLKHSDSQRHAYEKDKQRFNLYLKLLFAMGVNWSMEVISWLVNWQTKNKYVEVWYLTDFFNAVYGVFIFFIFVFKKKTWKLLQKRYYNFVGKPHLAQTMTSSNTRTSHYSSTNYSTAETTLTDRTNGAGPEEVRLRQVS